MADPVVIVRPQIRRVVVSSPGPQGPPGGGLVQHADRHGSAGADPITPAAIGATAFGHTHTPGEVGLWNVDNTADAAKPVSTAQGVADAAVASASATDATTKANAAQAAAISAAATDATAKANAAQAAAVQRGNHTGSQTLSTLSQSGATSGQLVQWNGSAWVPVTFTAGIGGSTGATDNALLRADGVGGATMQSSGVTIDDSGGLTCPAFVIDQATYSGRTLSRSRCDGSNESIVIEPTGTGYLSLRTPDGTAVGGNQRGANSVDLQLGSAGGNTSIAAAQYSFCAGWNNQVSAIGGACIGVSNTVNTAYGVAVGQGNVAGYCAFAAGLQNVASGAYAVAVGLFCNATQTYAGAYGGDAVASLHGQQAFSAGAFATAADSQISDLIAKRATSDATPAVLFLDGSSARLTVRANTVGRCTIRIVARDNTAGALWATADRVVSWWRGVAVGTTVISGVDTAGTDRGSNAGAWPVGWAVAITADTTNGAISITATGAAATNIRWTAAVTDFTETQFA